MKFHADSPVFQFLNTLSAFIALNVVFLITCLPVITIGPAVCALYDVTMREARGEYGYLIKPYLRSLGKNFKKGLLLFLILFVIGMVLLFNIVFWSSMESVIGMLTSFVISLAIGVYLLTLLYAFPLTARFDNTIRQTLKNAFHLAVFHRKQTICQLLIAAAAIAACLYVPQAKIFMLFLGFSFLAYCQSFLFIKVFRNYEELREEPASA